MAHITLVLPYALPLPEFAPDLVRALDAPALAALLSRGSSVRPAAAVHPGAQPHEAWLARTLGVSDGRPAFANAAMRGLQLDPDGGAWHLVTPGHIQVARSHLMMADPRQLHLNDDDSRALFDSARQLCEELGHAVVYGSADTWFLRADGWTAVDIASPDTVVGMDLTDFMPKHLDARPLRRLQNEVQMAWHAHPANAAREARRLPAVNAFWIWGAGGDEVPMPAMTTYATPGWLAALGQRQLASLDGLDGLFEHDGLLVAGNLAEAAIAADWGAWLQQMQHLESALFAPLLAAVKDGRVRALRLVLSSREDLLESSTTPLAQRKFWRRPTLDALT